MHEYAIADNLVSLAEDAAQKANVSHIDVVHIQLGALSGVVGELLSYCFDVATVGTLLQGAQLCIEHIPVAIYCGACKDTYQLDDVQDLFCPVCGIPATDVQRGREIRLVSLEQHNKKEGSTS